MPVHQGGVPDRVPSSQGGHLQGYTEQAARTGRESKERRGAVQRSVQIYLQGDRNVQQQDCNLQLFYVFFLVWT